MQAASRRNSRSRGCSRLSASRHPQSRCGNRPPPQAHRFPPNLPPRSADGRNTKWNTRAAAPPPVRAWGMLHIAAPTNLQLSAKPFRSAHLRADAGASRCTVLRRMSSAAALPIGTADCRPPHARHSCAAFPDAPRTARWSADSALLHYKSRTPARRSRSWCESVHPSRCAALDRVRRGDTIHIGCLSALFSTSRTAQAHHRAAFPSGA